MQAEIDTINANIALSTVNVTLDHTAWSNDLYTVTDADIDPAKEIIMTYPTTLTDAEYEAYQDAIIRPYGAITSGSMTLKAVNGAPDIDLPLIVMIRG